MRLKNPPGSRRHEVQVQAALRRRLLLKPAGWQSGTVWTGLALLGLMLSLPAQAGSRVAELRCEYLRNPTGLDVEPPRLSMVLEAEGRGRRQTAYQILVASTEEKLKADRGDLWDSCKVSTDQSIQVPYAGALLRSREQCFWKVRIWDQDGKVSPWSAPARWTMGLLEPSDWNARWIGLEGENQTNYLTGTDWIWSPGGDPAPLAPLGTNYFRRVFLLPAGRTVQRARLLMTGDSECSAFFNGRDIGGRNNYRTVRDTDVTYRLAPGTNVIAVIGANRGASPKPAGLIARLEIEFEDGGQMVLTTDDQWRVSHLKAEGWTEPRFDDSSWVAARRLGPAGMAPWGNVRCAESRRLPARWLRKEFTLDRKLQRATVSFSGLGLSELYLNGAKVGDHVLSPGLTEYSKRVFYVTYEVTRQLRSGVNALGVILGNGRYYAGRSSIYAGTASYGFPKLLLNLRLEFADGSTSELVSDETWKVTDQGPIVANNEFDGEEYDARKELPGWSRPGFDASRWPSAQLVPAPGGAPVAEQIQPIRITQTIKPISVTEPKPGVFIFDLGQNMVGWCRLKVSGPAGSRISLRHAETLQPDGTLYLANLRGARVTDLYTLKGGGTETWEPRFVYHGFRYVEVKGFPGKPTLETLEGRVVHDDVEPAGEFACSNPLLNRIYTNVVWGVRGNYRSIPTDCPQRDERQGWLGDRSEESRGESYSFDTAALYSKWLRDIADAQKDNGSVPDVAPSYWPIYTDNVTWPSSSVIIPSTLYRQFGDGAIIASHYASAARWIDHMLGFVTNGIISRDNYGDWCVPPEDPRLIHSADTNRITDKALLATAYFYHDLRLMAEYAALLGREPDGQRFSRRADEMKTAFNARFLNRDRGQYDNGTQTSCVLPLAFGLVPEDQAGRVFDHLVAKITGETKGHIGTGLIGGQYLNRVLSDHGRADLAYTIASQRDYPSWGYMVEHGATTIWELWNGDTADPAMNSGNHVMLVGDLVIWLYEYLAGIQPDAAQPGFKHLVMKPRPVGDLAFVKATHRSPYGLIRSEWRRRGGQFDWRLTVPANTTATVFVPATGAERVREGGQPAAHSRGVQFLRMEPGRAVFAIGSGEYYFSAAE